MSLLLLHACFDLFPSYKFKVVIWSSSHPWKTLMAKISRENLSKEIKKGGLVVLSLIKKKIKRSLSITLRRRRNGDDEEVGLSMEVPEDVMEGQFVVFAVDGGESKRFVVDLGYLNNPEFLRMLEQAEEEFGFKQHGAITIPCRPDHLQRILEDQRMYGSSCGGGGSGAKGKQ